MRSETKSETAWSRYQFGKVLLLVLLAGVFADMMVPRFGRGSQKDVEMLQQSSLMSNLATIRSQVDLYRIQHHNLLPGENCLGEAITEASFIAAMTSRTSEYGDIDSAGEFGPYLQSIPVNAYMPDDAASRITVVENGRDGFSEADGTGWAFDSVTGEFFAWHSAAGAAL